MIALDTEIIFFLNLKVQQIFVLYFYSYTYKLGKRAGHVV